MDILGIPTQRPVVNGSRLNMDTAIEKERLNRMKRKASPICWHCELMVTEKCPGVRTCARTRDLFQDDSSGVLR